jgi:hypothetical protein
VAIPPVKGAAVLKRASGAVVFARPSRRLSSSVLNHHLDSRRPFRVLPQQYLLNAEQPVEEWHRRS